MKFIILFVLALPFSTLAQECKLKTTKDQFTQQPKVTTGFINFNNARLSIDADSREITFLFVFNNGANQGCFDDMSTVAVAFDGTKTKANLRSGGPVNCEGYFHVVFKNTPTTATYLQRLSTQKATSFTFTSNTKTNTVIVLTEDQKEVLMEAAACMAAEAKKLIK
jgi:hypothetical protein